jgi:hypothetical protein
VLEGTHAGTMGTSCRLTVSVADERGSHLAHISWAEAPVVESLPFPHVLSRQALLHHRLSAAPTIVEGLVDMPLGRHPAVMETILARGTILVML